MSLPDLIVAESRCLLQTLSRRTLRRGLSEYQQCLTSETRHTNDHAASKRLQALDSVLNDREKDRKTRAIFSPISGSPDTVKHVERLQMVRILNVTSDCWNDTVRKGTSIGLDQSNASPSTLRDRIYSYKET